MRIAIKYDDIDISSAGRVAGHEAGDTLVRRSHCPMLMALLMREAISGPIVRE